MTGKIARNTSVKQKLDILRLEGYEQWSMRSGTLAVIIELSHDFLHATTWGFAAQPPNLLNLKYD